MAMIGITQLQRALRHAMKTGDDRVRYKIQRRNIAFEAGRQRRNIGCVIMIGRQQPDSRLPAHGGNRVKYRIMHARRGGTAILRVERRDQNTIAARGFHRVQPGSNARISVAHRPVHHHAVHFRSKFFGLFAGVGSQWRTILGPDQTIGFGRFRWTGVENDSAQNRLPDDRGYLDNPLVRQKLLEIPFDRLFLRRIRRTEIDQQNADFLGRNRRMVFWQWSGFTHDLGYFPEQRQLPEPGTGCRK